MKADRRTPERGHYQIELSLELRDPRELDAQLPFVALDALGDGPQQVGGPAPHHAGSRG